MISSPIIRPIKIEDADIISAMAFRHAAFLNSLGDNIEPRLTAERYRLDGFGPHPHFWGFIAEDNATALGYLLYCKDYDVDLGKRVLFIIDLWVEAQYRQIGIGKALMNHVAAFAKNNHYSYMKWDIFKPNLQALRFYESLGAHLEDVRIMYKAL